MDLPRTDEHWLNNKTLYNQLYMFVQSIKITLCINAIRPTSCKDKDTFDCQNCPIFEVLALSWIMPSCFLFTAKASQDKIELLAGRKREQRGFSSTSGQRGLSTDITSTEAIKVFWVSLWWRQGLYISRNWEKGAKHSIERDVFCCKLLQCFSWMTLGQLK